jgi:hypothetical protein
MDEYFLMMTQQIVIIRTPMPTAVVKKGVEEKKAV